MTKKFNEESRCGESLSHLSSQRFAYNHPILDEEEAEGWGSNIHCSGLNQSGENNNADGNSSSSCEGSLLHVEIDLFIKAKDWVGSTGQNVKEIIQCGTLKGRRKLNLKATHTRRSLRSSQFSVQSPQLSEGSKQGRFRNCQCF